MALQTFVSARSLRVSGERGGGEAEQEAEAGVGGDVHRAAMVLRYVKRTRWCRAWKAPVARGRGV